MLCFWFCTWSRVWLIAAQRAPLHVALMRALTATLARSAACVVDIDPVGELHGKEEPPPCHAERLQFVLCLLRVEPRVSQKVREGHFCEVGAGATVGLSKKSHCSSGSPMDTLYNQPKVGGQRAHPAPASQFANLQLHGGSKYIHVGSG